MMSLSIVVEEAVLQQLLAILIIMSRAVLLVAPVIVLLVPAVPAPDIAQGQVLVILVPLLAQKPIVLMGWITIVMDY